MKFDLIFRNSQFQIFRSSDNTLFKKHFLYVYRQKLDNDIVSVKHFESNHLPLILMSQYKGFLFIKDKVKIKQFMDFNLNASSSIPKSAFIDLSEVFKDHNGTIAYVLCGSNGRTTTPMTYVTDDKKTIKKNLKKYIKEQNKEGPKTAKGWFKMILEKAPMICYDSIKNNIPEITKKDVSIFYDLRVKNEFEVIKEIENIFIDKNMLITVYNDYSDLYNQIIKNKLKVYKIENDYLMIKYKYLVNSGMKFSLLSCLNQMLEDDYFFEMFNYVDVEMNVVNS